MDEKAVILCPSATLCFPTFNIHISKPSQANRSSEMLNALVSNWLST